MIHLARRKRDDNLDAALHRGSRTNRPGWLSVLDHRSLNYSRISRPVVAAPNRPSDGRSSSPNSKKETVIDAAFSICPTDTPGIVHPQGLPISEEL